MSIRYRNQNGQEVICSGLTPGGDIEAGAVMTRSGQISVEPLAIGEYKVVTVTFDDPMPDNIYIINIDCTSGRLNIATFNKTVNGFSLVYLNSSTLAQPEGDSIVWTATKTYTVQHAAQNTEDIATLKAVVPASASTTNQLTTKSYVDNADNALDSRLDDIEDVIPTGASISNQLVTKNEASVDSALSSTSEHAVQNKVVKAALDAKQDTLTFDNVPTAGSNNPVKSSGIKSAIDAIPTTDDVWNVINDNGSKNLYNYVTPKTLDNFSVDIDTGDLTNIEVDTKDYFQFKLQYWKDNAFVRQPITATLTPGTYSYNFTISDSDDINVVRFGHNGTKKDITIGFYFILKGTFTITFTVVSGNPSVVGGLQLTNIMIRQSKDPKTTWKPFAKTNLELTNDLTRMDLIYIGNNMYLSHTGCVYQIRFNGCNYTEFTAGIAAIQTYLPTILSGTLFTDYGGKRYLATYENNSVYIIGTLGDNPTPFANASNNHKLYGNLVYIRDRVIL